MFKIIIILAILPLKMFCQEIMDTTAVPEDSTIINIDDTAVVPVDTSFKQIKEYFKTFQYNEVIMGVEEVLTSGAALTDKQKIELYRMKAVSHFSLLEDESSKESLIEILKTDSAYTLDQINTSPKIISFFDSVKVEYYKTLEDQKEPKAKQDTIYIVQRVPDYSSEDNLRTAVFRSLLIPGLGHLYNNDIFKGGVLTGLSIVSLSAMIYLIVDNEKKKDKYLNAKDRALFPELYNNYNKVYKMRNISIIFYSALWLYTQIDLLFFSDVNEIIQPIDLNFSKDYIQLNLSISL